MVAKDESNATLFRGYQIEEINDLFLGYNDETRYSVSLLPLLLTLVFSIWFGIKRSKELGLIEQLIKENKLAKAIPRIEDIKPTQNKLNLRPLGNLRHKSKL